MSKLLLLQTPHVYYKPSLLLLQLLPIHLKPSASPPSNSTTIPHSPTYHQCHRFSMPRHQRPRDTVALAQPSRSFSARAFESEDTKPLMNGEADTESVSGGLIGEEEEDKDKKYPSGEFRMKEFGSWMTFLVKLRMLIAPPWQRVKKGSVLTLKLRGQISDQLKSSFSSGLSLPQICENFEKAAYDPRIAGIYIHFEPLNCGWGKVEEIRRHIINFKQSGKFIVGYVPVCGEKEYFLACACDELYAPPSAYFSLYGMAVQASFLGGNCFLERFF